MSVAAALKSRWAKPIVHLLCLLPFCALVWAGLNGGLGANPVEKLTHQTGLWALRLLLVTLAVTPLRQWSGQASVTRFRRILGLYSFFYASAHFGIWILLDHAFDFSDILEDIIERQYITLGFGAMVAMIPLAVTSNRAMLLRLGKRWKTLHQLVYLAILLAVLHFIWLARGYYLESGIYAIIAIILLLHRVGSMKRLGARSSAATG